MPNFHIATLPAQMALGELLVQGVNLVGQIADYKHKMAQIELQHQQMMAQAKLAQQQIANQLHVQLNKINALQTGFGQTVQHFATSQHALRDQMNHNQQAISTLTVLLAQCTADQLEVYQTLLLTLMAQQADIRQALRESDLQMKDAYAIYGRDVTGGFDSMRDVD